MGLALTQLVVLPPGTAGTVPLLSVVLLAPGPVPLLSVVLLAPGPVPLLSVVLLPPGPGAGSGPESSSSSAPGYGFEQFLISYIDPHLNGTLA